MVQALAPSPLLGLTGSGIAEKNFGLWAANGTRSRIAGLGDEASLRDAINVKHTWKRATLNVRQDNVLIYIYYSVKGQKLPSTRTMESRVTDVARDVLALQK